MNKPYENIEIYDLLNYVEIEEDLNTDFQIDEITSKRIKSKIKKKLHRKSKRKYYTAASLMLVLFGAFTFSNSTLAMDIKQSFIQQMEVLRGDYANYSKYTANANLSSSDKGIKLTINEIATDANEMFISYSIISDKKLDEVIKTPNASEFDFKVNGKPMNVAYGGSGKQINANRYDGIIELDIMREKIPHEFYFYIHVSSIDKLQGNWEFNIKLNKKEIQKETKNYAINKAISIEDKKLSIKNISISPLSTSMEIGGDMWGYDYFLFDDKGNFIKPRSGSSDNTNGELHFNSLPNKTAKSLTFIPYNYNDKYVPTPRLYDIDKLPLELSQGYLGKLVVNKLELINDTLKVSYTADGIIPVQQSQGLVLFDEKGQLVQPENEFNTQITPENNHDFIMYFKNVNKDKKYRLGTENLEDFYIIRDDLKFSVDLK